MKFIPGQHELSFSAISSPSEDLKKLISRKLDNKTKPLGSLGRLETLAQQMGMIQNTLEPIIINPTLLIFAGDHGIALDGVSSYPQEVTFQMVLNFIQGGAAASVLSKMANMHLEVIDAGVNHDFDKILGISHLKVGKGTQSFLNGPAMTEMELAECFIHGKKIIQNAHLTGSNLVAFGEMGIGNTSSSSILTHLLTGIPLLDLVGSGTGLDQSQVHHKYLILERSLGRFNGDFNRPGLVDVFQNFGGFEIMMMAGSMLESASLGMIILVDGFISTAAFLCAYFINPIILNYAIFSHLSEEKGHILQLNFLKVKALLNLSLRLGEGTGAILALPLLQSAVAILNEMASFEAAGVSKKSL